MKIHLDHEGNSFSWFNVMPRYKVDKEGDVVTDRIEILQGDQRRRIYTYFEKAPGLRRFREINCSLEATS